MSSALYSHETIVGHLPGAETGPSPSIRCWIPARDPTGAGLVIFAGGGYAMRSEHEGNGYAAYFARAGIACFVVDYRLGVDGFRHWG